MNHKISSEPRTFSKGLLFGLLLSASPSCMLSAEGKPLPINDNLEAMAKQLYDYWFVQFDFPNEDGKPYKSSGGAMVWNEKLKREIPIGWTCCSIKEMCDINKKTINKDEHKQIEYLDTGSITQGHISNTEIYRVDMAPSRAQRKVEDLSILYSSVRPRLLHYGIDRKSTRLNSSHRT